MVLRILVPWPGVKPVTPTVEFQFRSLSWVQLFATPWTAAHQTSLSITNSWNLLKLTSIESVISSTHLMLCCPLLLPSSIFPSIRVFSDKSVLHSRWPKYWSFILISVLPMNILDWFPLRWTGWISLQSEGLSSISPAPQFKRISSSTLRFLYSPTLTSIHDYWKSHSFD